jgi:hypothetical protein
MLYIGDTRAGTLVGTDRMGNKFYENITEELPLRVRMLYHLPWSGEREAKCY